MGKRFLASVADVDLFETDAKGELKHFATAKTLTDSSIGFSIQMEEVRGGRGAKLYGKFGHTTGMTISMTDVMFDLNYIRVLLGAAAPTYGASVEATISASKPQAGAKISLPGAAPLGKIGNLNHVLAWGRIAGESEDTPLTVEETAKNSGLYKAVIPNNLAGKEVCITYYKESASALLMNVSATYFPQELVAILKIQEYAGEASQVQTGKPVGHIIVKIPRYQLDGQFDLGLNMTSAASVSLSGSALAFESANAQCEFDSYYAEIVEVIESAYWADNLVDIIIDPDYKGASKVPHIWGIYANGSMMLLDNDEIAAQEVYNTTTEKVDTYNGFIDDNGVSYSLTTDGYWNDDCTKVAIMAKGADKPTGVPTVNVDGCLAVEPRGNTSQSST